MAPAAGLRTNALVSAGAGMFVMLAALTARAPDDSFRIAGQVVSGIGFLGAGVILRNGLSVAGLNTAATLWCSAAIGPLASYGLYGSAVTGAVAVLAANVALQPIAKGLNRGTDNADAEITICSGLPPVSIRKPTCGRSCFSRLVGKPSSLNLSKVTTSNIRPRSRSSPR